jgi:hypothetical protein
MSSYQELAPIAGWFIPRIIPYGAAPEYIKADWLHVPLPFRDPLPEGYSPDIGGTTDGSGIALYEDGIRIRSVDAIKSLRLFEREAAADWWREYFISKGRLSHGELLFDKSEGEIQSTILVQRLLPGVELFDSINIEL